MKTKTKKKKDRHYGEELAAAIEQKGLKKVRVAGELKVSRQWFDKLLESGNFDKEQMKVVRKHLRP